MIEWGQNVITQKILKASNKTLKNPCTKKLTPKTCHSEFLSLKNFQKALNDITCCTLFGKLCLSDTRMHYQESSSLRASSPIWEAKRASREHASEGPRKGELATISYKFSFPTRKPRDSAKRGNCHRKRVAD